MSATAQTLYVTDSRATSAFLVQVVPSYQASYPGHTMGEFRNDYAFAALKADGSVVTWGDFLYGGDSSAVASQLNGVSDVVQVFSNQYAFAALRTDGSVVTWGASSYGGDSSDVAAQLNGSDDVVRVFSTTNGFAALRIDGSVVTWGVYGGDSSGVATKLNGTLDVQQIFSTQSAFAALRVDGSVITWGNTTSGGDSRGVSKQLDGTNDVIQVFSTAQAFAALRADGSVVTWGDSFSGGDSSAVQKKLNGSLDAVQIFSTASAFAALMADGSVVTWGDSNFGGSSSSVTNALSGLNDVDQVFSTERAFAARRVDGSVITWGDLNYGGNSSAVANALSGTNDVKQICATERAFAALRVDGSVVTWGDVNFGGSSAAVMAQLNDGINRVKQIFSTDSAFAALKEDGSVVTWGDLNCGGNSTGVATELDGRVGVVDIFATASAFAALRKDGTVVTWGDELNGGDSNFISDRLENVVGINTIYSNNDKILIPNNAPVALAGSFSLKENSVQKTIIGSIQATDKETKNLTYKITGGNSDVDGDGKLPFIVGGDTGIVTVNDADDLNYERIKKFDLIVRVSDGDLSVDSIYSIKLTNLNEAPTGSVTIRGTTVQGNVLTAISTIQDPDGMGTEKFQWVRDGKPIANATKTTYTLTSADVGKSIGVQLFYTDGGGFIENKNSLSVIPSGLNPGVIIGGNDKTTGENGDTAVFSVKLNKAPSSPVDIQFGISDSTEGKLISSKLTFTAANWYQNQSLTVTGVDDYDDDQDVTYNLTASMVTSDSSYKALVIAPTVLTNHDDGLETPINKKGSGVVDKLIGNNGSDYLYGEGNTDELKGGRGNDQLYGGPGNDHLYGEMGDDILDGGTEDDVLDGGDGVDTTKYTSATAAITVDLTKGTATSTAGKDVAKIGTDTLSGIENVIAGNYNDTIKGNTASNTLTGGLGMDSLYGGVDKVKDVFDFNAIAESKVGTSRDKVYDFVSKTDKIDLSGIDANTAAAKTGDQAFVFAGGTAKANAIWFKLLDVDGNSKTTDVVLYGDVDGNTTADFEIGLVGVGAVVVGDFVL